MKRGRLYACCRREGYNVLALGQHLDDLAESFLMGAFLNGELRAMKAWYVVVLVIFFPLLFFMFYLFFSLCSDCPLFLSTLFAKKQL
jgi:tRNA(Ile)-lysidine synthase TilS/MesJ